MMIRRILVPLDGSTRAEGIQRHVITLAETFGASVELLHVVETRSPGRNAGAADPLEWRLNRARSLAYLEGCARPLRVAGMDVSTRVEEGAPAQTIVELLRHGDCDAVAMTTHGSGNHSLLRIGCTATAVTLNAPASVLLVAGSAAHAPGGRDGTGARYRRVVAPVDCSPRSDWALGIAARIARGAGASLGAIHVLDPLPTPSRLPRQGEGGSLATRILELNREAADRYLAQAIDRFTGQEIAADGTVITTAGSPAEALRDLIERGSADLVVLSAHGGGCATGWPLGGTAYKVVLSGRGAVLLLQDQRTRDYWPESARAPAQARRTRATVPSPHSIAARPE